MSETTVKAATVRFPEVEGTWCVHRRHTLAGGRVEWRLRPLMWSVPFPSPQDSTEHMNLAAAFRFSDFLIFLLVKEKLPIEDDDGRSCLHLVFIGGLIHF